MRIIKSTEQANWNPVPLVSGQIDWECNKQDNFGEKVFLPMTDMNYITIPAIYIIPDQIYNAGIGTGAVRIYVTDTTGINIGEITQLCSIFKIAGTCYLKVPRVTAAQVSTGLNNRGTNTVFISFLGLDKTSSFTNAMLCSELYQLRYVSTGVNNAVEKQSCVTLRWWSDTDQVVESGGNEYLLPYQEADMNFELSFDAQLSKPEYKKEQEGSTRDGLFFPEKTIITKEYHFFFRCPEYVLDALRFVHLADHIEVQQGTTFLAVDSINFDIDWDDTGSFAKVDCSFTTGTILRKSGTTMY